MIDSLILEIQGFNPFMFICNSKKFKEWPLLDAFYFTLVSLSTVGFGDLVPREHPPDAYGINTIL